MRLVWMIWVSDGVDYVWLSDAWDDDTVSENGDGWAEALKKAQEVARVNGGEVRVQRVRVPGVQELFRVPDAEATVD